MEFNIGSVHLKFKFTPTNGSFLVVGIIPLGDKMVMARVWSNSSARHQQGADGWLYDKGDEKAVAEVQKQLETMLL